MFTLLDRLCCDDRIKRLQVGRMAENFVFASSMEAQELEPILREFQAPLSALKLTRMLVKDLEIIRNRKMNDFRSIPDGFTPQKIPFELKTSIGNKLYGTEDALEILRQQKCQILRHMLGSHSKSCIVIYDTGAGMVIFLFSLHDVVQCTRKTKEGVRCKGMIRLDRCIQLPDCECRRH